MFLYHNIILGRNARYFSAGGVTYVYVYSGQ